MNGIIIKDEILQKNDKLSKVKYELKELLNCDILLIKVATKPV